MKPDNAEEVVNRKEGNAKIQEIHEYMYLGNV